MNKFIRTLLLFFAAPVLLVMVVVGLYLRKDVYMDFGPYPNYSWKYYFQQLDDLSTKKYLQSEKNYNSFILGSSRSVGVYGCYLQSKIPNSRFFHYGSWSESIGAIHQKLWFLDSTGVDIQNVVLYIDTDNTFHQDGSSFSQHYIFTGATETMYRLKHMKTYLLAKDLDYMKILLGMDVHGEIFPNWKSDKITNDCQHQCSAAVISKYGFRNQTHRDSVKIDSMLNVGFLYARKNVPQNSGDQISEIEEIKLAAISEILKKHHTNFYVVITPLYDQIRFNTRDLNILKKYFGNRISDFSGVNSFTNDPYNFPDRKHFLPMISKIMLDSVLNEKDNTRIKL
jgi:hypothetical protein